MVVKKAEKVWIAAIRKKRLVDILCSINSDKIINTGGKKSLAPTEIDFWYMAPCEMLFVNLPAIFEHIDMVSKKCRDEYIATDAITK